MADEVVVMYLGRVVEKGSVDDIFHNPTASVHQGAARIDPERQRDAAREASDDQRLDPAPVRRPAGCPFYPRCTSFMPGTCDTAEPELIHVGERQDAACFLYGGVPAGVGR